ncbi:transmembrane emp24 domain-containing protein 9-like [Brachionichthys hirsutus]|uniref:transmembrane emp24 domain-containing protein 9-like n=1 Tax=Brachionichthys hirsutus TaxID=412623 RepID=UPI003604C983
MSSGKRRFVLAGLLLNVFNVASSVYFHVGDTERKCFTAQVPEDTNVTGNFQAQLIGHERAGSPPANQDLRMFLEARSPYGQVILSQRRSSKGSFSFTSRAPGTYELCLQPSSSRRPLSAGSMLRVDLDFQVGEGGKNGAEVAARDELRGVQRVRELSDKLQQILQELAYHRVREQRFREIDRSTNGWMFWWPVLRSLYVAAVVMLLSGSW